MDMASSSGGWRPKLLFFFNSITEKYWWRSRVAVVVNPSRHPRLCLGDVGCDFPLFALGRFLFDPHGVVARDAVVLARALEESALRGETQRLSLTFFFYLWYEKTEESSVVCVIVFLVCKQHKRQKRRRRSSWRFQTLGGAEDGKSACKERKWCHVKIQRHLLYNYSVNFL